MLVHKGDYTKHTHKMKNKFIWSKIAYGDTEDNHYYAYYGGEELGYLKYWKPWKKWVWSQNEYIIMSESCLKKVLEKLKRLEKKT